VTDKKAPSEKSTEDKLGADEDKESHKSSISSAKDGKSDRLAQALRDNLRRRQAQKRRRAPE